MQYFQALKLGQKRVAEAREYLNKHTDGRAMPALALSDTKLVTIRHHRCHGDACLIIFSGSFS